MKNMLACFFLFACSFSNAQQTVSGNQIQTRYIREGTYKMQWHLLADTVRKEIGEVTTTIEKKEGKLMIVQNVHLLNRPGTWMDTTIADLKTIEPVYHSSSNMQRAMTFHFSKQFVTGFYQSGQNFHAVNDTASNEYFDSNIYPNLIAWLPLEEGYRASIPVYNYNSASEHGIVPVLIQSVKKEIYQRPNGKKVSVFAVHVKDAMGQMESIYFIDAKSRITYEIQANTGNRKMIMQRE